MQEGEYQHPWPQPQIPYPQQYHPTSPASSLAPSPWSFQNSQLPPTYESFSPSPLQPLHNPWGAYPEAPPNDPDGSRQRTQSLRNISRPPISPVAPLRPHRDHGSHAGHAHSPFPQPETITRSTSAAASLQPPREPRPRTKSDLSQKTLPPIPPVTPAPAVAATALQRNTSVASTSSASPFYPHDSEHYYDLPTPAKEVDHEVDKVTTQLSNVALDSPEGLLRFQKKQLNKDDEAWHRLVPAAALEVLDKKEVQRQSVIFEVLQSERDYVADLEAVSTVIIRPIVQSSQDSSKEAIIPRERVDDFIHCVFGNFAEILGFHQVMLGYLFARQTEQHPLIQSIADIILDVVVREDFRTAYEVYIKHYPVAESKHKQELERNPAYKKFLDSALSHPQMDKRDLFTLLFRPVTRLPRMNLLLEQILKKTQTEYGHPDLGTLPIILGILEELLKSTQPGVEVAKNKVKLGDLRDNILYQKGEIIDMDLDDEHRSLVFTGPVCRKLRSDAGAFSTDWVDLTLTLLDNYLVFVREDKGPDGKPRRYLASRPLPVIYLKLGSFGGAVENRKERTEDGGLFDRHRDVPVYPFVIVHAANRSLRRYTLYVTKEEQRKEWETMLVDTVGLARAKQDANLWFNPLPITKRSITLSSTAGSPTLGRITTAVPFSIGGRDYVVVGCQGGVYVSARGEEKYRKAFNLSNPAEIVVVQTIGPQVYNKLLIQYDNQVMSFSLEVVAKFWQKQADGKTLADTQERVAGQETSVLFFKHIQIGNKPLLLYTTKRTFSVTPTLHVLEVIDSGKHGSGRVGKSFRQYGQPGYVPKDIFEVVALSKNIGVCTKDGIIIIDPLNITNSKITVVPDLERAKASIETTLLKERIKESKPLGLVKLPNEDLLVVFDTMGCYISKHGEPVRKSRYVRWEATAQAYAHRGEHVLLFSTEFIEIRHADTGKLAQAIQGTDVRLLWKGPVQNKRRRGTIDNTAGFGGDQEPDGEDERILVGMRDKEGVYDKVIELVETKPISVLQREQLELDYPYPYPFQQEIMFGGPAVGGNGQMPMVMPTPDSGPGSAHGYGTPLSPITPNDNGVPAMWEEWDM